MTSVSQQSSIPPASNSSSASQSTPSYASTAKKAVASPPSGAGSSTQSPVVAVGGSAPAQQHGKSSSVSPVNGRTSIPPAVPAVAPAIAHSSSAINGATDHSRQSSVTISATGPSGYVANGGPVGGSKGGIQFGSITDSPAASHSTPQTAQTPSASIAMPNPRVTSPAQSPSPIPQPSASGGKPPSGLTGQNNGALTFGSLTGDGDRHMRQASGSQGPAGGNTQTGHQSRESQSNTQHDMSNQGTGATRGGFGGGRGGRGNFTPQYNNNSQMGFPPGNPPNNAYRGQGRGAMAPPFQGQSRQFPNSPHQAARSPALTNSMPGTPNMNQAIPNMPPQQYGAYGGYPHMPPQQVHPHNFHQSQEYQVSNHGGTYNGKKRGSKQRFGQDKSHNHNSNQNRQREFSQELFSHQIQPVYQMTSERNGYYQQDKVYPPPPMESSGPGRSLQPQQINGPPSEALVGLQRSSDDQPTSTCLPPLPPPLFADRQFDPKCDDFSPASGNFEEFLTTRQQYYPQQYDPRAMQIGGQYMYPQMGYMTGPPPQSPQPGFQQPHQSYVPGQYAPQPMSRNSSQMSADQRPASSMGQPQTPSMAPSTHPQTPSTKIASVQSPAFSRPARKSAAISIKRPDTGDVIDVQAFKAPVSPAPSNRAKTPSVIASTPTPVPKSTTPQNARTDNAAPVKSSDQIKAEIAEKVRKAAASEKADSEKTAAEEKAKAEEAAKVAEEKRKEEEKVKAEADAKAAEEAKAKEEADAKAAEAKRKQDEEDELERQIAEMEAAEAEREKKEEEALAKRNAAKAEEAKKNEAKRLAEAEENDRKLKEQEREMERIEDEREKKRAEAESKAGSDRVDFKAQIKGALKGEEKNTPTTLSTLASNLSNLTLGTDSGASTPASNESMGPPPSKAGQNKKVPAALNLAPLNTKPVEAPQPSAALQSLKSARFLTAINPALYPSSINSPNPALNSAVAAKGKSFKYDSAFLLQFQKVFVEKPSMEFESQIKNLIGDGDAGSARSASTRGGGGMGPRTGSTRGNAPGAFAMGQFAAGGKTLPPGTTSAERFNMSNGSMPRPAINPMASFGRPGGAFPGGNQMTRTPSSSNMGYNMPNSPRQQSRSQRGGGSKRDSHQGGGGGGGGKSEAQAAKTMPLTAGMDLKPIQVSASGWKPRSIGQAAATGAAGPTPGAGGATGHMEPDMVQRKVKAALNKMTPEKFDKIADQILVIAAQSKDEADGRTLRQVIQLTFEKATDEAHWASMYAKFCKRMLETMSPDIKDESIRDKNGNIVSGGNLFRKYLLNRCQEEFERGWKLDLPDKPEGERGDEKSAEATMLSDEYYIAAAAKRRGLGLVQFIGELYKLSMLTERIMHQCVQKLVDYTGIPDEAEVESLTKLLKTIGHNLDGTEKGKPMMDVYFTRIQAMIDTPDLPSRLRFMLMDIVDLRRKRWASKEDNKGPKTLDEVRLEAEAAAAQKAAENARGPRGGGGGGGGGSGRMQMGRGDSRNFSGQYGSQPPVDYQKNTVGMDDLRRLTNKGGANRHASQNMSFGPTSMFSSRSNSGRKMGPGGSLSRTGEDSGASSRTGTPPQQKEKESATSANAFSLLAGLGSGEPENPASPPSTSVSPALSKATPATAEKSDDKKDNE